MLKFLLLFLTFSSFANTNTPFLTSDISQVLTYDAPYDSKLGNGVRHRAIIRKQLAGEGYQLLLLEKIVPGKFGNPDKVLFSTEVFVSDLPSIKEYIVSLSEKSTEATFGCCDLVDLAWADAKLQFKVTHGENKFFCLSAALEAKDFNFICNPLK